MGRPSISAVAVEVDARLFDDEDEQPERKRVIERITIQRAPIGAVPDEQWRRHSHPPKRTPSQSAGALAVHSAVKAQAGDRRGRQSRRRSYGLATMARLNWHL